MKTLKIVSTAILVSGLFLNTYAQKPQLENENVEPASQNTTYDPGPYNDAPSQSGFHLGLRYQPTFTSFKIQDASGSTVSGKATVGNGYALSFNFYLGNYIGLHLEGIYSELAQKFSTPSIDRTVKVNYINIPLLISFNTNYGRPVNFNVTLGPQMGFNTGTNLETSNATGGGTTQEAVLKVKPADVGVAYGAGFDFGIGEYRHFHINLGFRGVYGLVNVNDDNVSSLSNGQYYVLQKSNVKTYAGYLGIMFKL